MDSFIGIMALVLWAIPPLGAFAIYYRLAWYRDKPLPATASNLLRQAGGILVVSLLFVGGALIFATLFRANRAYEYFGLAFPKPPGLFTAIAFTCAIAAALLALHAFALGVFRSKRG